MIILYLIWSLLRMNEEIDFMKRSLTYFLGRSSFSILRPWSWNKKTSAHKPPTTEEDIQLHIICLHNNHSFTNRMRSTNFQNVFLMKIILSNVTQIKIENTTKGIVNCALCRREENRKISFMNKLNKIKTIRDHNIKTSHFKTLNLTWVRSTDLFAFFLDSSIEYVVYLERKHFWLKTRSPRIFIRVNSPLLKTPMLLAAMKRWFLLLFCYLDSSPLFINRRQRSNSVRFQTWNEQHRDAETECNCYRSYRCFNSICCEVQCNTTFCRCAGI